jgi:hypothetical protein
MAVEGGVSVGFGRHLRLLRFGIAEGTVEQGRELGIELRWQTHRKRAQDYAVLLRLVDAQGRAWAAKYRSLLNSSGSATSAWKAGEISEQRYLLPVHAGIPPGQYQLDVVVYEADTLQSVAVLDAAGASIGAEYTIATVNVVLPAQGE